MAVGQVFYTPWCDEHGKVIDDGTVSRLGEQTFRWTAADPSLRWFRQNAAGLRRRRSRTSRRRLPRWRCRDRRRRGCCAPRRTADIDGLKYFRVTTGTIAGVPVDISRTGYTGDLGYEIWMPAERRGAGVGRADGRRHAVRHQAGRHAGAGRGAGRGRAAAHRGRLLQQQEGDDRVRRGTRRTRWGSDGSVIAATRAGSSASRRCGRSSGAATARQIVGLEVDWTEVEQIYEKLGLPPAVGATASRVAVPVYRGGRQVGRATTTTWSPVLKKMIALATVDRPHYADGTVAADRGDRRSRAPPRRRDGGADAVLQSGAERRATPPAVR